MHKSFIGTKKSAFFGFNIQNCSGLKVNLSDLEI